MSRSRFRGRTLARSQALQLLYQAELTGRTVEGVLSGPFVVALDDGEVVPAELDDYARELALGCDEIRPQLDALIASLSRNWTLTRMPSVDRNLLRLAIFEMLCVDEVAVAVTIDESVELAKAFGTDESSRFINGLLGRVADQIDDGVDVLAKASVLAAERAARASEETQDEETEGIEPSEESVPAAEDEGSPEVGENVADAAPQEMPDEVPIEEAAGSKESL